MTDEPPTLLYLVKQVELAVRARLDDLVRPAGLTALQYTALTVLQRHPDLTAAQLARRSFVSAQSTADLIAGLQSRRLVERHRDAEDRRRLVLVLTDAGHDMLAHLQQPVADLEARMVAGLSPFAVDRLRGSLETCRTAMGADRRRCSGRVVGDVERPTRPPGDVVAARDGGRDLPPAGGCDHDP